MEGQPPQQLQQEAKDSKMTTAIKRPRLRMMANYETFHPQVMTTTTGGGSGKEWCDYGALAGPDQVVVFRWDHQPQIPTRIFHHPTGGEIQSLAFSPLPSPDHHNPNPTNNNQPVYLAAVRGSSILIWDIHSQQPLQRRLGMTPGTTVHSASSSSLGGASSTTITSMTWIAPEDPPSLTTSTTNLWMAATTSTMAGLWNLGSTITTTTTTLSSSSSSSATLASNTASHVAVQRPTVRFADATQLVPPEYSPYRQIAVGRHDCATGIMPCAILSASGIIRIYQLHIHNVSAAVTVVVDPTPSHFIEACHSTGVGLAYIALPHPNGQHHRHGWVTWGLDASHTDPVVKVWMDYSCGTTTEPPMKANVDKNDDSAPNIDDEHYQHPPDYRLMGQCTVPNLACARVCPWPIHNTIVTISFSELKKGTNAVNWRANIWKLHFNQDHPTPANGTTELLLCDSNDDDDYGLTVDSTLEHIATFTSDDDDNDDHLGVELMTLRSAELTLLPSTTLLNNDNEPRGRKHELVLCGLTENGYLTTHSISEITTESTLGSDQHGVVSALTPTIGPSTKLFPANPELPIEDAAFNWGNATTNDGLTNTTNATPMDRTAFQERRVAFSNGIIRPVSDESTTGPSPTDAALPPFYTSAAFPEIPPIGTFIDEVATSKSFSADTNTTESDQADFDATTLRNATNIMANIETDRIPCPRLCGASFSFGVGGLTTFNNGGVKRMWEWYEKRDSSRTTSVPGLIGEPSLQDLFSQTGKHFDGDSISSPGILRSSSPRTFNDLISMTVSAKEAQWGRQEESGALSTEFPAFGSDFFDDDSNASSDSGADNLEDSTDKIEYYSQGKDRSAQSSSEVVASSKIAFPMSSDVASEMLAPSVNVSKTYIRASLNNQCVELAQGWKLGDFDVALLQPDGWCGNKPKSIQFSPFFYALKKTTTSSMDRFSRQDLPSYRSLLPATPERKDDTQSGGKHVEYESVHGGAYSVRPNMQESMVFLRKLFTQQHQQEGKNPFPNLLSPPDDPLLPNKVTTTRKVTPAPPVEMHLSTKSRMHEGVDSDTVRIGVHTIPAEIMNDAEDLKYMEEICEHNAKVCEELGEIAKMGTWRLVSKIVQGKRKSTGRGFDGWGNALGSSLIDNLLTFYESLGDVQMLSSLVCVLRDKHQFVTNGMRRQERFLPKDQNARYDLYIRCYSELLYGWGLFTKRAELLKHRTQNVLLGDINDYEGPGGISFEAECPQCAGNTHFGYCRPCNDFSFRCSICDNAVRGLFTVCITCGHGGHVGHMTEWFKLSSKCPTGCGCICKLQNSSIEK